MNYLKVGTSCLNQTPLDWDGNLERILKVISEARKEEVEILCLPELAITGYGCEDQFLAEYVCETAWEQLHFIAEACDGISVAVGLPVRHAHAVWNAVALISNQKILGFYAKQNLAGDGIHYEPRWFRAWEEKGISHFIGQGEGGFGYPMGDTIFEVGGIKIGFEICEDAWVADRPGRRAAESGCDLILNPSASHFSFGKQVIRRQFVQEGSRAFACTYLYANLLGNEAGRAIYDGGAMIAHGGEMVTETDRFSFQDTQLVTALVDVGITRLQKAKTTSYQPAVAKSQANVSAPFTFKGVPENTQKQLQKRNFTKEEEFTYAVSLSLFDYLRKSYSNGFIVSLSGGADSAAVSCLVALMRSLAIQELGEVGFNEKLAYLNGATTAKDLLFTAYQATANSGKTTKNAAKGLAEALGAEFQSWDVNSILQQYHQLAEQAIQRPLNWDQDDITLQNIQARVRAPGIWMMANIRNALLLSTSNRSEAAVGYATMDGDTCGGLSPIAGIDKAFLRHWLSWLEKEGAETVAVIPELRLINEQQPTAELRPEDQNQTDEDDLMPYPVLDEIERLAIRDKKGPKEIFEILAQTRKEFSRETRKQWVVHFFQLWSRNQWKRERYAPSFHLDDANLDPKTWCRFPILSGGFKKELAELI